jgi:two-component system response regulator PilR (NtrC family)
MRRVFDLVSQAAPTRTTILIQGESGTGKELVARAIHANSLRSDRPFITVNSGSLPPDLFESNLFGHVKGAFTGAVSPKKGLFELANRGSIFFDEMGSVPLETQAKLRRVIQEREFMRLGGVDTLKVDVRIIAATNIDLKQLVDAGRFREDLYYRLHVITVELPGLRERIEDIPLLAQHFLVKYGEENHKPGLDLSPEAVRLLEQYHWPGNVRELENVIERAVVFTSGTTIGAELIPEAIRSSHGRPPSTFEMPPDGVPLRKVIEEMETMLISHSLDAAGGVQKRAAELLRVKPTTLNEMIKRYGINPRGRHGRAAPSVDGRDPERTRTGTEAESIAADLLERRLSSRG